MSELRLEPFGDAHVDPDSVALFGDLWADSTATDVPDSDGGS